MEITSMLSDNTDVVAVVKPQESPAAKSITPKPVKRKSPAGVKPEVRSKRALAATKHRLAEQDAYTLTLSAFFAQGELTWQKEGLLCDLRQMLRISDEHHQREMQRIWANQTLCASARQHNNGKDNSERQKSVYDIVPEVLPPSDTESEPEDAAAAVKKKKKKKKSKPSAPTLDAPASAAPVAAPTSVQPAAAPPSLAAPPSAEKPIKVLLLKKAAKKAPAADGSVAPAPSTDSSFVTPSALPVQLFAPVLATPPPPAPAPQQAPDEMSRLQREKQKLQEELARLAAEGEEEDEDGTEGAAGGSPDESEGDE